jgi:hypothetical protein
MKVLSQNANTHALTLFISQQIHLYQFVSEVVMSMEQNPSWATLLKYTVILLIGRNHHEIQGLGVAQWV